MYCGRVRHRGVLLLGTKALKRKRRQSGEGNVYQIPNASSGSFTSVLGCPSHGEVGRLEGNRNWWVYFFVCGRVVMD